MSSPAPTNGNALTFHGFGLNLAARGWALLAVILLVLALGPALAVAYVSYSGFQAVERELAGMRADLRAFYFSRGVVPPPLPINDKVVYK